VTRELIRLVAAVAVLLLAIEARAANPCGKAYGVTSGSTAPCGGVLQPTAEALAGQRCLLVDLPLARAATATAAAHCANDAELAAHHLRACQAERDGLRSRKAVIVTVEKPAPWWRSPWLWGAIGVVAGGAAVVYHSRR